MSRTTALSLLAGILLAAPLVAQEDDRPPPDLSPGTALNLGFGNTGLSLGNSSRWNGVRVNLRDRGVREINGLNLTLWKAASDANPEAKLRGIMLGIVGPEGAELTGLSAGLGVVSTRRMTGINLGILGLVSEGGAYGINIGGLGMVAEGGAYGINIGGLGVVADGGLTGVNIGGLGAVAEGGMIGLNFGGLGVVAEGGVTGLNIGGLGVVGSDGIDGISVGGLGVVGERRISGIAIGGLGVVTDERLIGAGIGIGHVRSRETRGISTAGWVRNWEEMRGVTVGAYNEMRGTQRGLAIGIYNSAEVLKGVQIGLLNRAKNNKPPFRWLPIVNVNLN